MEDDTNKKGGYITQYLKRFASLVPFSKRVRRTVVDVVYKETGISLDDTQISYNGNIIKLSVSPIKKNEILRRKKNILKKTQEELGVTRELTLL